MSDGHPRRPVTRLEGRSRIRLMAGRAMRAAAATLLAATALVLLPASAGATTPAGAAPAPGAPAAWASDGRLQLSVTPSKGLAPNGAEITVRGSGFNRDGELWIAVCQDDGVAPEQFAHCLGGPIPNANATTAWAVVSPDGNARYAGPVNAKFGGRGQFKVTMQIPVAAGQDADCIQGKCSVYTRSADPADRTQDASEGIRFSAPRPSSETAPSTEVVGGTPTTVEPDSVAAPQISPGEEQTVVFSTFTPQEPVDVTLYSDPIKLPTVTANGAGVVTVSFEVPADLPLGEHLIQAEGRTSGIVGVASFSVVEPLVTTTSPVTTSVTAETTTGVTDTADTETSAEAPIAPDETGLSSTLDTAEQTAVSSESPQATDDIASTEPAAGDGSTGNRLLWLWIMLIALVVIGGAAAAVAMMRRRRDSGIGGPDRYHGGPGDAAVAEPEPAPSWEDMRAAAPAPAASAPAVDWPLYGGAAADRVAGEAAGTSVGQAPAQVEPEGQLPGGLDQLFGAAAAAQQESAAWQASTAQQAALAPPQPPLAPPPPGPAPVAHDDGGPATEQFRPVFQDGPDADAADYMGDESGGGRHHRSD